MSDPAVSAKLRNGAGSTPRTIIAMATIEIAKREVFGTDKATSAGGSAKYITRTILK